MHMSDALITPVIGGLMWGASGIAISYASNRVNRDLEDNRIPMMGVMGAFVFAAQMVNFTIPLTGSSGHLGGGMLLSVLLGPFAGFLTMTAVLIIQALFFADGGLLALGANIFNMGFLTCFVAYPLIYKNIVRKFGSLKWINAAAFITAVMGLQFGAFGVVVETFMSGQSELPIGKFLMFMQPIHFAIGIVEGLITVAVITFIYNNRPELILKTQKSDKSFMMSISKLLVVLLACALFLGGFVALYASSDPDGLEWSIMKTSNLEEVTAQYQLHEWMAAIQEKTSFFPDYSFKNTSGSQESNIGTSVAGILGGLLILISITMVGYFLKFMRLRKEQGKAA